VECLNGPEGDLFSNQILWVSLNHLAIREPTLNWKVVGDIIQCYAQIEAQRAEFNFQCHHFSFPTYKTYSNEIKKENAPNKQTREESLFWYVNEISLDENVIKERSSASSPIHFPARLHHAHCAKIPCWENLFFIPPSHPSPLDSHSETHHSSLEAKKL
jgi:hypothetical protein